MASRSTEGRREMEAANQRLAAAKDRAASAAKQMDAATKGVNVANVMLETAKKNVAAAKRTADMAKKNADAAKSTKESAASQVETSNEELKKADAFLKEAEERWEVIDIDENDAEFREDAGRKKRKVGDATISVEGCGSFYVDGTYSQSDELSDGAHVYCRPGRRRGEAVEFQIWFVSERVHDVSVGDWTIGCVNGGGRHCCFYIANDADGARLPPKNGWEMHPDCDDDAEEPAPRLKW